MAQTRHVEMREGERWADVAEAFMGWYLQEEKVICGGGHEGGAVVSADGRRYAAVSVPDHSHELVAFLHEWASREGRAIR